MKTVYKYSLITIISALPVFALASGWTAGDDAYCVYLDKTTLDIPVYQYKVVGLKNSVVQLQSQDGSFTYREEPLGSCYKTKEAAETNVAYWKNQQKLKDIFNK